MKIYERIESGFEKVSEFALNIFVNSIVFSFVVLAVSVWFGMVLMGNEDLISKIRDLFIAVSFLTFFMVQRVLKKYNTAMNVKLNELVRAQENAHNEFINVEKLSEKEIDQLASEHHDHQNRNLEQAGGA